MLETALSDSYKNWSGIKTPNHMSLRGQSPKQSPAKQKNLIEEVKPINWGLLRKERSQ